MNPITKNPALEFSHDIARVFYLFVTILAVFNVISLRTRFKLLAVFYVVRLVITSDEYFLGF